MDEHYDSLFDNGDEEDERYHRLIPSLDAKILRKVVEADLEIINNSKMTVAKWARFKLELLKCEEKWQTHVFSWIPNNRSSEHPPYIGIQIDWDSLENKATRYFQVHMCFENVWFGSEPLANIWEVIE